jgi:hypothetical protein
MRAGGQRIKISPVQRHLRQRQMLQRWEGSRDQLGRCSGAKDSLQSEGGFACQQPIMYAWA